MIDLVALQKAYDHLDDFYLYQPYEVEFHKAVRVVVTTDPQWKCAARGFRANPCDKRHGWEKEDNPKCGWVVVVPVRSSE